MVRATTIEEQFGQDVTRMRDIAGYLHAIDAESRKLLAKMANPSQLSAEELGNTLKLWAQLEQSKAEHARKLGER